MHNTKTNKQFCAKLKQARMNAGYSQKSLGIKLGISRETASARMNQYEKGVYQPSLELLVKMAAVLNVPVDYFFTDNPKTLKEDI